MRMRPRDRLRAVVQQDDGVSLVEMMVAVMILAIVLTALASASITALAGVRTAEGQVGANQLASEVLERLQSSPWASVAPVAPATSYTTTPQTTTRGGYTYTSSVVVRWVDDPCNGSTPATATQDYLSLDATVTWQIGAGPTRTLRAEALRVPTYAEKTPVRVAVLAC